MIPINPLEPILSAHQIMILDGALATELEQAGCNLADSLWSAKILLEAPELIKSVHHAYFEAGADCAITASYQATIQGFEQRGIGREEATTLIQRSVQLAITARQEFWANPVNRRGRSKPIVAASIGPYGAYLADGSEYHGDYGLDQAMLIDFHRPRLDILAQTQADIFACETIPCLTEAQALAQLLAEYPDKTAWMTFTAKDEAYISNGESIIECVRWLNDYPQIVAVGVNCTHPKFLPGLIKTIKATTDKAIVVYPNSGEGYSAADQTWVGPAAYNDFGQLAEVWHQCGASIIGGCCRTTPTDIQAIAAWASST